MKYQFTFVFVRCIINLECGEVDKRLAQSGMLGECEMSKDSKQKSPLAMVRAKPTRRND